MADKINATCSICGKGYYKCLSCMSDVKSYPWKQYTDTSEHYKIFQVIKGYNTGIYTAEEARDRLKTIDLSDLAELRDNIRHTINKIMDEGSVICDVNESEQETPVVTESVEYRHVYGGRKKKYIEHQNSEANIEVVTEQ